MNPHIRIIEGMATFACPECKKEKTADVSKYKTTDKIIKVGCKCPCGHSFTVSLDRRESIRKDVVISGVYILLLNGKEIHRDQMAVMDVSKSGLKIKLFKERKIEIGDRLIVKFNLNDDAKTYIQKEVVAKYVSDLQIGVEFCSSSGIEEDLFL